MNSSISNSEAGGGISYLAVLAVGSMLLFASAWFLMASLRKDFLETGYAVWQAKLDILEKCQLGDVVILGDS